MRRPVFIGDFSALTSRQRKFGAVRLAEEEGFELAVRSLFHYLALSGAFSRGTLGVLISGLKVHSDREMSGCPISACPKPEHGG